MMHMETTAGQLRLALKAVSPAVSSPSTIPVLTCVLIKDGTVTATDMDMQIRVDFAATRSEGACLVVADILLRLLSEMPPDAEIKLQRESDQRVTQFDVTLVFAGGFYHIPGFDPEDFPDLGAVEGDTHELPEDFKHALEAVSTCISTEETRYYLNGICFSKHAAKEGEAEPKPVLVATDGHRMAAHETSIALEHNPILPYAAVAALLKLPSPTKLTTQYVDRPSSVHCARMRFIFDGGVLITKMIDGIFPEWQRVLPAPDRDAAELSFEPSELSRCMSRLAVDNPHAGISLTANDHLVTACVQGADGFKGAELVPGARSARWRGGYIWSFNVSYLSALANLYGGHERINFKASDSGSPALVTSGDHRLICALMPMRDGDKKFARGCLLRLCQQSETPSAESAA